MSVRVRFDAAVAAVNSLPQTPPNDKLLELYGLYKQGTVGDVQGKRPGILDMRARAKYDAWSTRQGMSQDVAMEAYIALAQRLGA
jgi:acyl-CoA-binding protein